MQVVEGQPGLAELEERWRSLYDALSARSLVHAYDWHRSFIETQEPDPDSMLFVVISVDGRLQAILPLRPARRPLIGLGRPGLEVPLNPHVPFTDILVRDPAVLRAAASRALDVLATTLGRRWDFISIRRTLNGSGALRSLAEAPDCSVSVSPAGRIDTLVLESYDELFCGLSSHFRNNLRRARKRAESTGDITFHSASGPEDCEAAFEEFLQVEASGWKGTSGTGSAIALDARLSAFYRALAKRFSGRQACQIDVMRHGSRPVAAVFHLAIDGTIYGLKIGYDESYARMAPGNLLHWHIFRAACEDPRMKVYNMASDAAWHSQWRPSAADLYDIVVFRPGRAGHFARFEQGALAATRAGRRVVRRRLISRRGKRHLS